MGKLAAKLIEAEAVFAAALRVARLVRLPATDARRAAFACAHRHTGVDLAAEVGYEAPERNADPLHARLVDILPGLNSFEMKALVEENSLGAPSAGLYKRIGAAVRRLGWRPHRGCVDGKWNTVWKPSLSPPQQGGGVPSATRKSFATWPDSDLAESGRSRASGRIRGARR